MPVFYRGEQVGERRRYDERLAMFLLRYRDPPRYGKWNDRREWRGHPEGPAFELNEALEAVRQDAGLNARDIPRRFVKRLHELADKVLRLGRNAPREEF